MRKQTTYYAEPGDTVYLIDDNLDIREIVLNEIMLADHRHNRVYISDEVGTIKDQYIVKNSEIRHDQLELLEVEFFDLADIHDREDFDEYGYRYYETDRKAFTTKEAAESYLMTKIDKNRIARMILKEINEDLDIHLTEIEKILKNLSDRLREFDIPENVLLNSNLCKISELCDLLDLDQADILHLSHE